MEGQQANPISQPTPQQPSPTQSQPPPQQEAPQQSPQAPASQDLKTNIQSTSSQTTSVIYASFLKRLLAGIIDSTILGILGAIIRLPFNFTSYSYSSSVYPNPLEIAELVTANPSYIVVTSIITIIVSIVIPLTYHVGLLTWKGATIGKMALGLVVVDTEQGKITLTKAAMRETIGKSVSGIVLGLGYFWVIWDEKKQGWHDKIAGTVVVEKKSLPQ